MLCSRRIDFVTSTDASKDKWGMTVEIHAYGGPVGGSLEGVTRVRSWLQVFGEAEDHPGCLGRGSWGHLGKLVCGEALRWSWRRGVGDSEGVARVRLLLQAYGLAGHHPGLNQRLGFSRDQSEVGAWSPRNLWKDADS